MTQTQSKHNGASLGLPDDDFDTNSLMQPSSPNRIRVQYCYTTDYHKHAGKVKIGDTTAYVDCLTLDKIQEAAEKAAYRRMNKSIGIAGLNGTMFWFRVAPSFSLRDHRTHSILADNGYPNFDFENSGAREWFEVSPELALEAFNTAAAGLFTIGANTSQEIILREEQERFINETIEAYNRGETKYLWNAKMRFGKTLTAYSLIEKLNKLGKKINKVLIKTHRPVVNDAWAEEFEKILAKYGYQYCSKDPSHKNFSEIDQSLPFVCFISMQDARGKDKDTNEFKASNDGIYDVVWDMVITDEVHEGNDTELALEVNDKLKTKFTLLLSGTPFKYLVSGEFNENQISSWDYINEQEAKEAWSKKHINIPNPYDMLAKLWINTITMSDLTKNKYAGEQDSISAFNFAEFFDVDKDGIFVHLDDVLGFLNSISPREIIEGFGLNLARMPYSVEREAQTRHALWVLPSVASCNALKKLLEAHPYFKDYTVISVAGNNGEEAKKPLDAVRKAIHGSDKNVDVQGDTKTITLTVGRLTTGVTVSPWTAVLMLRNTDSATFYMQTIFRVQSPNDFNGLAKTDAFIYDFDPDRVLKVFADVADVTVKAGGQNSERSQVILGKLLNYMPVISNLTQNDITVIDAGELIQQLKRVYVNKVTLTGFDSNLLFTPALENLSPEIREALESIRMVSKGSFPDTKQKVKEVVISTNGFSETETEVIEAKIVEMEKEKKTLTPEQLEQLRLRKEELAQRNNMRAVLKTVAVRIPFLILASMCDEDFRQNKLKKNFSFKEFVEKIDNESWKEVFGGVTKQMFLMLEPAFDKEILQLSVISLVDEIENALNIREDEPDEYVIKITEIISRIKNPDKETVFTPINVVELVYAAAGLVTEEDWRNLILASKKEGTVPTIYDINVKSGVFPLVAAHMLDKAGVSKPWTTVCNESVFANARTQAGKTATCTLLGMDKDWRNITVIDVNKELEAEDISGLSYELKLMFLSHFLLSPLNNSDNPDAVLSDITNKVERKNIILIVENYEKEYKKLEKMNMSDEDKSKAFKDLESRVKKELNTTKQFDYVISNPPYQIVTNDKTGAATAIWQHFLVISSQISKHVAMINPARWQKGGAGTGLLGIKGWLMDNKSFHKVINMPSAEIFPTASISGEVSIEVIDNTKTFDNPKIGTWDKANGWSELKDFILSDEIDIPLSDTDLSIVSKIIKAGIGSSFEKELWIGGKDTKTKKITSSPVGQNQNDYGTINPRMSRDTDYFIKESEKETGINYLKIYFNEKAMSVGTRFIPMSEMQDSINNKERIPMWKALLPKTNAHFMYRNIGPIAEPNSLCTDTWLCRSFSHRVEAEGFNSYLKTYLYRYLISIRRTGHNALANVHRFVPDLKDVINPRTKQKGYQSEWIDDDLKVVFKDFLTDEDWKHIKETAIAADGGKGNYEEGWRFPDGSGKRSLTLPDTIIFSSSNTAIASSKDS